MKLRGVLFLLLLAVGWVPAEGHPGGRDANGCHMCRTNCDKWGEAWNELHCHNGKVTPQPKPQTKPKPKPKSKSKSKGG